LRVVLTIFGIVLGVAAFFAIQVTTQTSLDSISRLFENTSGKSDLVITLTEGSRKRLTERDLGRLSSMPAISQVVPSVQMNTDLMGQTESSELELGLLGINVSGLVLFGIDPEIDVHVRDYQLIEGNFLSKELDAYDIVLVESFAEKNDIEVGDRIAILTPTGVEKLDVIGLITREGPGQINNGGFGVVPLETLQFLSDRSKEFDQIDVVTLADSGDQESLESIKAEIQKLLGSDYSIVLPASQGERVNQMLFGYQIGLNFLSSMALFVGMFLIYNAFSMTVVERTREFGFLRTVGMTRGQITRQVLLEAVVLGLIGAILGVGFGYLLARGSTSLLASLLEEEQGTLQIAPILVATSLVLGMSVTVIAALIPAWQAGRISPLEALKARGDRRDGWIFRSGWLIGILLLLLSTTILVLNPFPNDVQFRFGLITVSSLFLGATLTIPIAVGLWERLMRPIITFLYGSSGQLGGRNIERSKQRTTLTVAALMIGVSMILITRGMTDSFRIDLESWIDSYIGGDLIISSAIPMREVVWNRIRAVEGVQEATPVRYFPVKWEKPDGSNEELMFMAVDLSSYLDVTSFVFSDSGQDLPASIQRLAQGDAVFISSVLSEKYDLNEGDTVTFRTRRGSRDFVVAAVVVDFFNQGQVIQGSWTDMRRHFNHDDASMILAKLDPHSSFVEVQERIEDRLARQQNLSIASNQQLIGRSMRLLNQSYILFDVMALIALLVAAMGVVNTMTMNVIERTQEIGMLRSIGLTRGQVLKMILAEAGLMGLIGGFLGLIFGILLTRIFLLAMTAMSGYKVDFVMPLIAVLAGVIISIVVSQVAALFPARRATRIDILEAIQYE
jgi:putative ABC transport system permease protein